MVAATSACSARKLRANRANAKMSTGPRTAEGKARSSRNATGYGIFCKDLVLPGEDRQLFDLLRTSLIEEHRPQNITELFLVDRMTSAMWRLRRIQSAEADAHGAAEAEMLELADKAKRKLEKAMRWEQNEDQEENEDQENEEDEGRRPERCGQTACRHVPSSVTSYRLINDGQGKLSTLEKLSLYEKRLEGTIHRCLKDLRKLRTPIKGERMPDRPSPFLETKLDEAEPRSLAQVSADQEVAREDENMKNEATAPEPLRPPGSVCTCEKDEQEHWTRQTAERAARVSTDLPPARHGRDACGT